MHSASQTNAGAQRTEEFTICGCLVDAEVIDSISLSPLNIIHSFF